MTEEEIEGWQQKTVLFGSHIGALCKGMTQQEVAYLFRYASICVRAYNPATGIDSNCPKKGHALEAEANTLVFDGKWAEGGGMQIWKRHKSKLWERCR